MSVGNCLCFRKSLYRGIQNYLKKTEPSLFNTMNCLYSVYPENIFADNNYFNCDLISLETGVNVNLGDPALQAVIQPIAKSESLDLWRLLPYMFSSCIFTTIFQNTIYKPSLDGLSFFLCVFLLLFFNFLSFFFIVFNNNCNVLIDTFLSMLVLFRSTCEPEDVDTIRDDSVAKYLEVASIIVTRLLRINQKDLQKKLPFASLASVMIFLDMVCCFLFLLFSFINFFYFFL